MGFRSVRRKVRTAGRRVREARIFARAMHSARHPVMAQIVPTRRCNLACAYCNEYDDVSPPVATEDMLRRVDKLALLGTSIVSISGGEPLLHPALEVLIRHIRNRGMIATLITNGYLLTRKRIQRLNEAGLHQIQISIDNLEPDEVSKKSLKLLERRLSWLAGMAEFDVMINVVLGASNEPGAALEVARRARSLGFRCTAGLLHGEGGRLEPLSAGLRGELEQILALERSAFSFTRYNHFQENLVRGLPNAWHCRAGARYVYICEDGLVHWCSQQRGRPAIPLELYARDDFERESAAVKACAPFCSIGCVHRVATLDAIRADPRGAITAWLSDGREGPAQLPFAVRALLWMFSGGGGCRRLFSRAAIRMLKL